MNDGPEERLTAATQAAHDENKPPLEKPYSRPSVTDAEVAAIREVVAGGGDISTVANAMKKGIPPEQSQ